jgi:hypothetical protein
MSKHTRRTLLVLATIGLVMAGIGYGCWALLLSLKPTETTLLSHQLEIELNELRPGQVSRVEWEGIDVFILRRTPEQMAWLESYVPPTLSERAKIQEVDPLVRNTFRSISPEYLVVGVWKNGLRWSLRENQHMSYLCDDFRVFLEPTSVSKEVVFPGGFYCAGMYGHKASDFLEEAWVYDPAGRSKTSWISPLYIPPHKLKGHTLVLGYQG